MPPVLKPGDGCSDDSVGEGLSPPLIRALGRIRAIDAKLRDDMITDMQAREPSPRPPTLSLDLRGDAGHDGTLILQSGSAKLDPDLTGTILMLDVVLVAPDAARSGESAASIVIDLDRGMAQLAVLQSQRVLRSDSADVSALANWLVPVRNPG